MCDIEARIKELSDKVKLSSRVVNIRCISLGNETLKVYLHHPKANVVIGSRGERVVAKVVWNGNSEEYGYKRFVGHVRYFSIGKYVYKKKNFNEVKNNEMFQKYYRVSEKALKKLVGDEICEVKVLSFPCHACGFYFPYDNVTIDHQRPQTLGKKQAVAKVFRYLGLTVKGPTGAKGLAFNKKNGNFKYMASTPVDSLAKKKARRCVTDATKEKYMLNFEGVILLSLLNHIIGIGELEERCCHHIFNLAPLCNCCNSKRGQMLTETAKRVDPEEEKKRKKQSKRVRSLDIKYVDGVIVSKKPKKGT